MGACGGPTFPPHCASRHDRSLWPAEVDGRSFALFFRSFLRGVHVGRFRGMRRLSRLCAIGSKRARVRTNSGAKTMGGFLAPYPGPSSMSLSKEATLATMAGMGCRIVVRAGEHILPRGCRQSRSREISLGTDRPWVRAVLMAPMAMGSLPNTMAEGGSGSEAARHCFLSGRDVDVPVAARFAHIPADTLACLRVPSVRRHRGAGACPSHRRRRQRQCADGPTARGGPGPNRCPVYCRRRPSGSRRSWALAPTRSRDHVAAARNR